MEVATFVEVIANIAKDVFSIILITLAISAVLAALVVTLVDIGKRQR